MSICNLLSVTKHEDNKGYFKPGYSDRFKLSFPHFTCQFGILICSGCEVRMFTGERTAYMMAYLFYFKCYHNSLFICICASSKLVTVMTM